jgi:lysophospholipid acyltransferase (LPLAT)-like uncharacterized protein
MVAESLMTRYRVDDVPYLLRPFHNTLSCVFGCLLYGYARLINATCRIITEGRDRLDSSPNHMFCIWHTFTPTYFCVFPRHTQHAWMQHPAWLVKHVHIVVRLVGVEALVFGSTGHGGRDAAEQLVEFLERGYSTVLMPDGPRGPPGILKDGVLFIAEQSATPIIPIRFQLSRYIETPGWDRKRWPLPLSTIRVVFGEPVRVTSASFEESRRRVTEALGKPLR